MQLLALPVLSAILKFGRKNTPYTDRLISNFPSLSSVTMVYARMRVLLIDTPPATLFADSAILASVINAAVIFIVDSEHTRRAAALQAQEQLKQVGITMKGVVVNRINLRDEAIYYDNDYYRSYYPRDDTPKRGLFCFRR